MTTSEQIKKNFLSEFRDLCEKWGAEFSARDHFSGYAECGEDVRITVDIPSVYLNGECIGEYTEIDLGNNFP